jgi:hypothetical protein
MSLRIIIECITKPISLRVEGIAIVDTTRRRGELMRHELGLWLRMGRSSVVLSSLVVWKKS